MKKREVCNGLGEPYDYPIVCIVRAGLSHRGPGDTKTIPGDIVIMDFSVKSEGFISDIARTAYCLKKGETRPPVEVQHAFDTAYKAISAVIDFIGPEKKGYEVDKVGRDIIEAGGYPTVRHSVGHPIGRKCHDSGTLLGPRREGGSSAVHREIKENEVYAIEPTIIQDSGLPCMLVEENVVIRKAGAEVLSRRQKALYLITE
jgi:Xaa-Pro aminopeptidase